MNLINFELVTPEKTVLSQELASLTCTTEMGEITILPHHVPLVATLMPGELTATQVSGEQSFIFVAGGFVQIQKNSKVIVLADGAEHHYEIDVASAEQAKQRAEQTMKEHTTTSPEYARVAATLQQSLARIHVARKHAHRKNIVGDTSSLTE